MQQAGAYEQQPPGNTPVMGRNNVFTTAGRPKCRFDMYLVYRKEVPRKLQVFTQRGDYWEKEQERFLGSLVKLFIKDWRKYDIAIIRDNTKPIDHPDHEVLVYKKGVLEVNKLEKYDAMLRYIYKHIPVEIEWPAVKEWRRSV